MRYSLKNISQSFSLWFATGAEDKRCPELRNTPDRSPVRHPVGLCAYWLGRLLG
jgi:hypothetical protein